MTLAQMVKLALRQLDEDPADVAEFEELFKMYANTGYQIILRTYRKPKNEVVLETDEAGEVSIEYLNIIHVVSVRDSDGRDMLFELSEDGKRLITGRRETQVTVLYEEAMPDLGDGDEPNLPEYAHPAIVDYICYRHLSTGNLAKQSRAEFYRSNFYQQAQMVRAQGSGSVKGMKNLYVASDIRNRR